MKEILQRLNNTFQEVFDDEDLRVSRETTAANVDGWDSLMHVRLILSIEKEFKVRFSSSEVAALKTVGDLADLIAAKSPEYAGERLGE
jgi:acyl carrier protein